MTWERDTKPLGARNERVRLAANCPERIACALHLRTVKKMGIEAIAKEIRASPTLVRRWLVERGMPTEDQKVRRAAATKPAGKPMVRGYHRAHGKSKPTHPNSQLCNMNAHTMPSINQTTDGIIRNGGEAEERRAKELPVTKADIWTCLSCHTVVPEGSVYCRRCKPSAQPHTINTIARRVNWLAQR